MENKRNGTNLKRLGALNKKEKIVASPIRASCLKRDLRLFDPDPEGMAGQTAPVTPRWDSRQLVLCGAWVTNFRTSRFPRAGCRRAHIRETETVIVTCPWTPRTPASWITD